MLEKRSNMLSTTSTSEPIILPLPPAITLHSTAWAVGKYEQALSFNGFSSYAAAGTAGLPGIKMPMTISYWFCL
jgi:hypothetical protein